MSYNYNSFKDLIIVDSILREMFDDNNTFSETPLDYAIIGLIEDKGKEKSYYEDYFDLLTLPGNWLPGITLKIISKDDWIKNYLKLSFELDHMIRLKPIIKILK